MIRQCLLWAALIGGPLLVARPVGAQSDREECAKFPAVADVIKKGAEGGNPYCRAVLGALYRWGMGVKKNMKLSVHWSQLAWEAGEPLGMYNRGVLLGGNGLAKNEQLAKTAYVEARKGFEAAVGAQDPHYVFSLGVIRELGEDGATPDAQEACRLHRIAAERGHVFAQTRYGDCLRDGKVGKPSPMEAVHWYEQAARGGDARAAWNLAELVLTTNLKRAQVEFRHAANLDPSAYGLSVGVMEESGELGKRQPAEALALYERASAAGNVHATYRAAWLLYTGAEGVKTDKQKAKVMFRSAAKAGDHDAANMVKALGLLK